MKFSLLLLALSLFGVSSYNRPPHQSRTYNIPVQRSQGNQNQPWWFGKTSMGKPVIGVTADGKPVTEESLKTIHRNLAPAYQLGEFSDFQAGSSEISEENKGYVIRMSRGKPVRVPIARDSSGDDSSQQISPSTNTGSRRTSAPYVSPVVRSQPPPALRQPHIRRPAPVPRMSSSSEDSTEHGGRYIIRMSRGRAVRVPVSVSGSHEDSSVESSQPNSVSSPSPSRRLYRTHYRSSNTHITRPSSDRRVQLPSHSSNVDESSEESGNYVIRMSRGKPVRVKVPAESGSSSADNSQFGEAFKPGKTITADRSSSRDSSGKNSLEADSNSARDDNKPRGVVTYKSPVPVNEHRGAPAARPWQYSTPQHTKPAAGSKDDSTASDSSSTDSNHHVESDESSEESGNFVIRMSRGKPVKVRVSGSSTNDDSSTSALDLSSESSEHSTTMNQHSNQRVYSPRLSPITIQQPRATYSARPWGSIIRQPVQTRQPSHRPPVKIITTTRRPIRTRPPQVPFTTPRPVTKQPVQTTQPPQRPPVRVITTRRPIRTRPPRVHFTTPRTVIFTTAPVRFRPRPTAGPTVVIPESSSSESFEEQPNQGQISIESQSATIDPESSEEQPIHRQISIESQSASIDFESSEEQPIHRQISIESQSATIDFESSEEQFNQRLSVIENQSSEEVHQMRQQVHPHNPSLDSNESHSDES